jgi:threonine 3-dehydrogenase
MWDHTMEIGRRLGADHLLFVDRPGPNHREYVRDHTYGVGVDVSLEMAGTNQSIAEAFQLVRKGGRITAFGVNSEPQTPIDYNNGLVFKGAQVHGVNGRKMFDTWLRLRNLLASGRLDIAPVITHLYALRDFNTGFKELMKLPRVAAKAVLFPDERELAAARDRLAGRNGVTR